MPHIIVATRNTSRDEFLDNIDHFLARVIAFNQALRYQCMQIRRSLVAACGVGQPVESGYLLIVLFINSGV
ncbi:hypothetical protein D3C78_1616990 [compost metagenome]